MLQEVTQLFLSTFIMSLTLSEIPVNSYDHIRLLTISQMASIQEDRLTVRFELDVFHL